MLGVAPSSGSASEIWGEALWMLNNRMSLYGVKFSLNKPLFPDTIDQWQKIKKKMVYIYSHVEIDSFLSS